MRNRILKSPPVGHERGGSNDAFSMSFDNGAIHSLSEAKVICIHNETPHWVSLAG